MTMAGGSAGFAGEAMTKAAREVSIRAADGPADVEAVRGLMQEYGEHLAGLAEGPTGAASICLKAYEAELAGLPGFYVAPGVLLLASVDGKVAGCVALRMQRSSMDMAGTGIGSLELKRLWVRPGFRGLRLGQRLMQAAIDHARAVGAAAIYLDTVPAAMPEANKLYEAMGFVQVERYNDNDVEDIAFFRLGL
jgi:GNAT superfamily N-acetyltransferase